MRIALWLTPLLLILCFTSCTSTALSPDRSVSDYPTMVVGQAGVTDVLEMYVAEGGNQMPPILYTNQQLSDRFHAEYRPMYPGAPEDPPIGGSMTTWEVAGAIMGEERMPIDDAIWYMH